jgi:hypothetical protein
MTQETPGSLPVPSVVSLRGGEVNTFTPNEGCMKALREMLEMAEAGEITGIVCARLHGDNLGSYTIAGMAGPYSLLGALVMAQKEMTDLMASRFE